MRLLWTQSYTDRSGAPIIAQKRVVEQTKDEAERSDRRAGRKRGGDLVAATKPRIESIKALYERSERYVFEEVSVRVACLDDLIRMIKVFDRPKDRIHLAELQALRELMERNE